MEKSLISQKFCVPSVVISGIFSLHDSLPGSDTTDEPSSLSFCFKNLFVQVDCEVLLKEMMEEAGEVVGLVVDLTNEAWAEKQKHLARLKNGSSSSSSSSMKQETPFLLSSSFREASTAATLMESTKSMTGQKLGVVKTVSEPELSFSLSTTASVTNNSQEGIGQDSAVNDDWHWEPCSHGADSLAVPFLSKDSDEENTNPSISAEKASHIIDYIFDEIDDGLIPPPLPSPCKKARLESLQF
jgi:hypothetical protein